MTRMVCSCVDSPSTICADPFAPHWAIRSNRCACGAGTLLQRGSSDMPDQPPETTRSRLPQQRGFPARFPPRQKWCLPTPEELSAMTDGEIHRVALLLRWPDGILRCPRCGCEEPYVIADRPGWRCRNRNCRYQFTATNGDTPLNSHKRDLRTMLLALSMIERRSILVRVAETTGMNYRAVWALARRWYGMERP